MRQKVVPNMPATTPPIAVLRELLGERGLSEHDLLHDGISPDELRELSSAEPTIGDDLSARLGKVFDMSSGFWKNLATNHKAALAAGKPIVNEANAEEVLRKKPSGNVAVRLPSSIHSRLLAMAKDEGTSLNQIVLSLISEGHRARRSAIGAMIASLLSEDSRWITAAH